MNSHLQEAAPDLLAALERLLPYLNRIVDSFRLDIPEEFATLAEDVATAEAAVRKAKGGN